MLDTIADDVLNALAAHIAVLDHRGVILAVNEAWRKFSAAAGVADPNAFVGTNYLTVCEKAANDEGHDASAVAARDGLRALMRGETDSFTLEYPCHTPTEERWFSLRASRTSGREPLFVIAHDDISERHRSDAGLRETERLLRHVLETLPVGVWIVDRAGRIVHGNPAGQRIWAGARYVGPEKFGEYKAWWLSTGQLILPEEWAAARAIRKGEISLDEEIEIECFDGSHKIILNSAMPLLDENLQISGAIIVNQDITTRKQMEKELAETLARERVLGRTDHLTGAFNRRHFFDLAGHAVAVARRYQQPLSVVLFDLDHFKNINDSAGHDAGDEALRRVAGIVREHLREADLFARYGGEEFILLLPRTNLDQATIVAERVRTAIAARAGLPGLPITISCGVSALTGRADPLDSMVRRADDALYRAKQQGRNRTVVAEESDPPAAH
jgi:diguanylate cyclase (GGDEF)-like protein